jgi:hypothetical protein
MIAPIDSVNLEERLQNGTDRLYGAAISYQTYLKKFSVFLNAPVYNYKGPMIAAIFFNDEKLAKYFIALGDEICTSRNRIWFANEQAPFACRKFSSHMESHRRKTNIYLNVFKKININSFLFINSNGKIVLKSNRTM